MIQPTLQHTNNANGKHRETIKLACRPTGLVFAGRNCANTHMIKKSELTCGYLGEK